MCKNKFFPIQMATYNDLSIMKIQKPSLMYTYTTLTYTYTYLCILMYKHVFKIYFFLKKGFVLPVHIVKDTFQTK